MEWQRKKRSAPQAPPRRTAHARASGKIMAVAFSDDEEDWLETGGPPVRVHPTLVKLTCAPDVATSEATTAAAAVEPAAAEAAAVGCKRIKTSVQEQSGVPICSPSDPLSRYVPLGIRRIPSGEDWLMDSLRPTEGRSTA
mmetsp:Transcript_1012/g.2807  ORF Transcript_1012/g.2807 Transcript_1012/m.2807 type:complete len:140 (-) Transcript_1012:363-782(-)